MAFEGYCFYLITLVRQQKTFSPQLIREICWLFQIDQNGREDFNLTSDGEFNAIKSLVLGRLHGK